MLTYIGTALSLFTCHPNLRHLLRIFDAMNSTTGIVGWTPEPQGRGTMGLLWSCFATIFLCTWSAVHPNVPVQGESNWIIFWRRIKHVTVCLVAPEIFALIAMWEFADARAMQAKVCCDLSQAKGYYLCEQSLQSLQSLQSGPSRFFSY